MKLKLETNFNEFGVKKKLETTYVFLHNPDLNIYTTWDLSFSLNWADSLLTTSWLVLIWGELLYKIHIIFVKGPYMFHTYISICLMKCPSIQSNSSLSDFSNFQLCTSLFVVYS
jgi:hypothetical protein